MIGLSEREEMRTLEAVKLLIDGGEIRVGELDRAVRAAVTRIQGILGGPTGNRAEAPVEPVKELPRESGGNGIGP